jgi:type IV pilus assembly protein PilC
MEYAFTARDATGLAKSGVVNAESVSDVRQSLRDDGLFVLSIKSQANHRSHASETPDHRSGRRINKTDILLLTSQLSIMNQAGLDLAESLQSLSEQCPNAAMRRVLKQVHSDVSAGMGISESLRKHSEVFGKAYVASIAAGEASGSLGEVLQRMVELLDHEIRLRATLRSVLAYPAVLCCVAVLVISALVFIVLPQFGEVFEGLDDPPPAHTQLLLDGARLLRDHILLFGIAAITGLAAAVRYWKSDTATRFRDGFLLNSRLPGSAMRSLLTGRSFRLLGTMLQSGIPLLEALRLCRESVRNWMFQRMFDGMEQNVMNGRGIGEVLAASPFIPQGAAQMIVTAERTGRLGSVMVTIGEFYEKDGEQQVRDLTKLLEPLIIVVMGAIVGGVVMAVMLPLLDISTASH